MVNTKRTPITVALLLSVWALSAHAQTKFAIDPTWPKPLPEKWIFAQLGGVCVDSHDHIVVVDRRNITDEEKQTSVAGPTFVMFDRQGNVVQSWGDPKVVPEGAHGCSFDRDNNLWVAGNDDAIVQGYSHEGKLLLQIGTKNVFDSADGTDKGRFTNQSRDRLFMPAQAAVDPDTGDIYVADGYGNKRVVVFDKTGKFLRQWGRQGTTAEAAAGVGGAFVNIVHCVVLGNDGLVYVCDRNGDRIQVFDKTGDFKRSIPIPSVFRPSYTGNGTGGNVVFSRDPNQKYMFIGDFSNKLIRVFDRVSGKELSRFGRPGSHQIGGLASPHGIAVDSKGNVYVAESLDGRRVQRFKPVPGGTATSAR